MLQKLIACLIGSSLALASSLAMAREYQVEIIVFDRLNKEISTDERWDFSSERMAERLRQMALLASKASDHQTSDQVIELEAARINLLESGYRILNTTSWQQPTSLYQDAPLIPLGDADTALASGFVRIYTTSLIYADLDLQLSPPLPALTQSVLTVTDSATDTAAVWVTPTTDTDLTDVDLSSDTTIQQPHYFIAEKRRLKFEQIHYFDHPFFGAILGVWPTDD